MNIKKVLISLSLILFVSLTFAQITEPEDELKKVEIDSIEGWKYGAVFNLSFSQMSLTNWSAGGQNSVALNTYASLYANYTKGVSTWDNTFDLGYGMIRQGEKDDAVLQKTDDKLDFSSKYGFKLNDNFAGAALINFKTQFSDGFDYPNDSTVISSYLAPAYLLGAVGLDYKPNKNLSIFAAPLTGKITMVMNQALANSGAFGVKPAVIENNAVVTPGENSKTEFGGYVRIAYTSKITDNINIRTKLDLFSNYLDKPDVLDVNWETFINMKVGKYITVSLNTHLIYDYDTKFEQEDGTKTDKVQFKELFGIGISYSL